MKISVIQLNSQTNKQKNINEALSIASEAIKADAPDLIALPEMLSFCGGTEDEKKESAESIPLGVTTQALSKFAKDNKIYLHGGSYFESAGDKIENKYIGKSVGFSYDNSKIHLFDITTPNGNDYRESDTVLPGSEIVSYKALNLSIGCSICYDLRFAELYLELAKQQVDIIMVPAAFTLQTGKDHWSTLLRARAIETQSYVVAPGQCGEFPDGDNGMRQTWGHSMIIDPWGNIVAQASDGPGWASAKIDEKYLKNIRSNVPVASHRVL